ncbi:hypothetical protein [Streptomyces monashensis]|uniref:hypothetical protein n=1 Tax=Streptomyces monashensis TaxID=1678012 RepID=UPI001160B5D8|nr:hypothetical protein [Streptomyces monashensis]
MSGTGRRAVSLRPDTAAIDRGSPDDNAHRWCGNGIITGDTDTYGRVYVGTDRRGLRQGTPS